MVVVATPPSHAHGFLFADLRDYTQFVERHGDQAAAELLAAYRTLVRAEVERHDGAEVRTEGDSFFVVFPSASAAIRCALAIVDAANAANAHEPARPIRVAIGIHAGETADTPEGQVGSAVNVAARVCAQAKAGEVLVTDTVRGLTRTLVPYPFVPAGSRRLKGLAEAVTLYRVLPEGTAVPRPRPAIRIATLVGRLGGAARAGIVVVAVVAAGMLGAAALNIPGPGATPTASVPATGTSAAKTASPEVVAPPGLAEPGMVDTPGDGILMFVGGQDRQDRLWLFQRQNGWMERPAEVTVGSSVFDEQDTGGFDYDFGRVLVYASTQNGGEIWSYSLARNQWRREKAMDALGDVGIPHVAFDAQSRQLIVFGGRRQGGNGVNDQTLAYDIDRNRFTKMEPPVSPAGRFRASMEYDVESDRVILFGGRTQGERFRDTWAYDFETDTWTEMAPEAPPPPTSDAAMVYDPMGDRLILFGGHGGTTIPGLGTPGADTWAYDFNTDNWTKLVPTDAPSPRRLPGMIYDAESRVVILFGGVRTSGTRNETIGDTWLFDPAANTWTEWTAPS